MLSPYITKFRMLLQRHVASLGRGMSTAQKNNLLDRCCKLEARITAYDQRISDIMKLDDDTILQNGDGDFADLTEWNDPPDVFPDGWFTPEKEQIIFPSALAPGEIECQFPTSVATIEAELRKGQIMDALAGLRLALGEKSLCFRTEVCNANSQRTTHRAWDKVHKFDAEARKCRSTYRHAWRALKLLPIDSKYLQTLCEITDEDLKVAGDLTDEQRFRQRSDTFPRFWRVGEGVNTNSARMQECMYYRFFYSVINAFFSLSG